MKKVRKGLSLGESSWSVVISTFRERGCLLLHLYWLYSLLVEQLTVSRRFKSVIHPTKGITTLFYQHRSNTERHSGTCVRRLAFFRLGPN